MLPTVSTRSDAPLGSMLMGVGLGDTLDMKTANAAVLCAVLCRGPVSSWGAFKSFSGQLCILHLRGYRAEGRQF